MIKKFEEFNSLYDIDIEVLEMNSGNKYTGNKFFTNFDELNLLRGLLRTHNSDGVWSSSKKLVFQTYGLEYAYFDKNSEEIKNVLDEYKLSKAQNKYNL